LTEPFIFVVESRHEKVTEYFPRHPTPVLPGVEKQVDGLQHGLYGKNQGDCG
jgi:hypothetical protein